MAVAVHEVAESMYQMVSEYQGKKKFKAGDLVKEMIKKYGEEECDKKLCKSAIRSLVDSGRCIYTYFGGSYIEIPPDDAGE